MTRRQQPLSLDEAVRESASFARLAEAAADSSRRLLAIQSLIPETLRPAVKPGPADGTSWCLVVENNTAAAKIKQLVPLFQARLQSRGWQVTSIRLKVKTGR